MNVLRQFANFFMGRRAHRVLCLVAALLLEGPVVTALVFASGACCSGDRCPIAAHHHAAKSEEMPADCEHNREHEGDKVRSCSITCCNTPERSAIHANVFLLTPVIELASLEPQAETVSVFAASESTSHLPPLSPPPKSLPLI